MRCKNCGWDNPDGKLKCEKCNGNLGVTPPEYVPAAPAAGGMKRTVSEKLVFSNEAEGSSQAPSKTCPKCGYPVSDDSISCPNCGQELRATPTIHQGKVCKSCGTEVAPNAKFCSACGSLVVTENLQPRRIQRAAMGTVIGGPVVGPSAVGKFCTLRPIAWAGEEVNYNPITYSGDVIVLNRANTDANNNSITSREQAVLTCEDGEWYIENRSELRTTFIRVNGKIKLTSGDIIVLGNREFEFKG